MATSLKNGGMKAVKDIGGPVTGQVQTYPVSNGYTSNIFVGDLVALGTAGKLVRYTVSTQYPIGVFAGIIPEGQNTYIPAKYFVANASSRSGFEPLAQVIDDPRTVFSVQADASVTAGDIGYDFDVTVGNGDTTYGISTLRVHASSRVAPTGVVTVGTGVVKVIGFDKSVDNTATDAYPYVLVKLNKHYLVNRG